MNDEFKQVIDNLKQDLTNQIQKELPQIVENEIMPEMLQEVSDEWHRSISMEAYDVDHAKLYHSGLLKAIREHVYVKTRVVNNGDSMSVEAYLETDGQIDLTPDTEFYIDVLFDCTLKHVNYRG